MKQYCNFVSKCRIWFTLIKLWMQGAFNLQNHSFFLAFRGRFGRRTCSEKKIRSYIQS